MSNLETNLPIYALTHEFFPKRGGIATFTEEMAKAAIKIGRRVEVWAPRGDDSSDSAFPCKIRRLKLKGSQDLSCQLRLAKEMVKQRRKLRRSIVYLSDPGPVLAMCYLHFFKAFKPARLVITFHGSEVKKFAANPGLKLVVNQLIKKADRLSVPSEFTKSLLAENFPAASDKTFITPGALRSDFTARSADKSKSTSERLRILTVGRLHPRKGQARIIEALNKLPDNLRQRVSLWIVGEGKKHGYKEQLKSLAKQSDFPVTFFGDIDNEALQDIYEQADFFAMTSQKFKKSVEGFGLVYLEAAAHGLPIVAHRIGGVAEAVSHGVNGLLVSHESPTELTAAFANLIEDDTLRQRLGRNGVKWAHRNCWKQSANLLFNNWETEEVPAEQNTSELPAPSQEANALA